jgi:hypothetical protein
VVERSDTTGIRGDKPKRGFQLRRVDKKTPKILGKTGGFLQQGGKNRPFCEFYG